MPSEKPFRNPETNIRLKKERDKMNTIKTEVDLFPRVIVLYATKNAVLKSIAVIFYLSFFSAPRITCSPKERPDTISITPLSFSIPITISLLMI